MMLSICVSHRNLDGAVMEAPRGPRGALIYGALLLGGRWPLGRDYFAPDGPASILDTGLLMKVPPSFSTLTKSHGGENNCVRPDV